MRSKQRIYYRAYNTPQGERVVPVREHSPLRAARVLRKMEPKAAENWAVGAEYYQKQTNGKTR